LIYHFLANFLLITTKIYTLYNSRPLTFASCT